MSAPISLVSQRKLLFVSGKGGVGKTAISQALALAKAEQGLNTIWITFEDPFLPQGRPQKLRANLTHLNCVAEIAFEEYATLKVGSSALTKLFLQNPVIRYLSRAAPGIHELVLLGKVWYETKHYDSVVVDLPSTGHGLAMFQSTKNFSSLFTGGPVQRDAMAMIETLGDRDATGHLIVAIAEEMPLQEALELRALLKGMFPRNLAGFVVNRLFPKIPPRTSPLVSAQTKTSPATFLVHNAQDYVSSRAILEEDNLKLWRSEKIQYGELPFIPPPDNDLPQDWLSRALCREWLKRGYL